jgi:phage RecT family recombinase
MANEKPKGKALQTANKATLRTMLSNDRFAQQMAAVLPSHLTPQRMMSLALLACTQTPSLLECTPVSVVRSVLAASVTGLEFNGALGHAYLVPYGTECQFMPGYRGLIDLVVRGGGALSAWSHIVYPCDEFDIGLGSKPFIYHKPNFPARQGIPLDQWLGTYLFAELPGATVPYFDFLPHHEVMKRKAMSKASRSDAPWKVWPEEMYRKAAVRHGVKYIPISNERIAQRLGAATEFDNRMDSGDVSSIIPEFDDEETLVARAELATGQQMEDLGQKLKEQAEKLKERVAVEKQQEAGQQQAPPEEVKAEPPAPGSTEDLDEQFSRGQAPPAPPRLL